MSYFHRLFGSTKKKEPSDAANEANGDLQNTDEAWHSPSADAATPNDQVWLSPSAATMPSSIRGQQHDGSSIVNNGNPPLPVRTKNSDALDPLSKRAAPSALQSSKKGGSSSATDVGGHEKREGMFKQSCVRVWRGV